MPELLKLFTCPQPRLPVFAPRLRRSASGASCTCWLGVVFFLNRFCHEPRPYLQRTVSCTSRFPTLVAFDEASYQQNCSKNCSTSTGGVHITLGFSQQFQWTAEAINWDGRFRVILRFRVYRLEDLSNVHTHENIVGQEWGAISLNIRVPCNDSCCTTGSCSASIACR